MDYSTYALDAFRGIHDKYGVLAPPVAHAMCNIF